MMNINRIFETFYNNKMEGFETAIPATITAVNGDTISARPCIRGCLRNMQYEPNETGKGDIAPIPDIPVLYPGTGSAIVRFTLREGDPVLLIAASRDIREWVENGWAAGTQVQRSFTGNSEHSFMALPMRRREHSGSEKTIVTIGNDGTVTITTETVRLHGNMEIDGDILATGEITAKTNEGGVRLSTHIHPTGVGPTATPTKGT